MTPDELYARGYSLEVGAWGVNVLYAPPNQLSQLPDVQRVHFYQPLPYETACQAGWEAAEVDFVKRRLS